jgi:sortase A
MSTTDAPAAPSLRHRLVRLAGWTFIAVGAVLLLYLVWLLWFTGVATSQAQQELLEEFPGFGQAAPAADGLFADPLSDDDPTMEGADEDEAAVSTSGGVAVLEFERPGSDAAPVNADPLVVVPGTDAAALRRGPGTYTDSAGPGERGNFVVVGHRTTYGAPFYDIDDIRPGDLVHATDTTGRRFTYRVLEGDSEVSPGARVVQPDELWVLGSDPLDMGAGNYITLISCQPRFSAAQRIVVFGELVNGRDPDELAA